jgi:hypothetical protein
LVRHIDVCTFTLLRRVHSLTLFANTSCIYTTTRLSTSSKNTKHCTY